jgi:hypothetical protein
MMPDKLNNTQHCTMCADRLVQLRSYEGNSATRVEVNGVQVCAIHDLVGARAGYPVHVREAIGDGQ